MGNVNNEAFKNYRKRHKGPTFGGTPQFGLIYAPAGEEIHICHTNMATKFLTICDVKLIAMSVASYCSLQIQLRSSSVNGLQRDCVRSTAIVKFEPI